MLNPTKIISEAGGRGGWKTINWCVCVRVVIITKCYTHPEHSFRFSLSFKELRKWRWVKFVHTTRLFLVTATFWSEHVGCGWLMILGDLFITFSILKGFSYAAENLIHDREDTVRESSVSVGLYPLTLLSPHQGATFAWLRHARLLYIPTVLNVKSPQRPQSRRSGERAGCSWVQRSSAASRIIRDKTPQRLDTFLQSWGGLGGNFAQGCLCPCKNFAHLNIFKVFKIRNSKPKWT